MKCRIIASGKPAVNADGALAYSVLQQGTGLVDAKAAVYGTANNCANQGLNITADLAGTQHYMGRVTQRADGTFTGHEPERLPVGRGLPVGRRLPVEDGLPLDRRLPVDRRLSVARGLPVEPGEPTAATFRGWTDIRQPIGTSVGSTSAMSDQLLGRAGIVAPATPYQE